MRLFTFSESQTIEEFGDKMALHRTDVEHLRSVFMAVENGDIGMLKSLGIRVRKYNCYCLDNTNIVFTGLRARRCQVFPRETCKYWLPGLICYFSIKKLFSIIL